MMTPELEAAQRRYRTLADNVGRIGYLGGATNEQRATLAFEELVAINNRTPGQPFMVLPKKHYRNS